MDRERLDQALAAMGKELPRWMEARTDQQVTVTLDAGQAYVWCAALITVKGLPHVDGVLFDHLQALTDVLLEALALAPEKRVRISAAPVVTVGGGSGSNIEQPEVQAAHRAMTDRLLAETEF